MTRRKCLSFTSKPPLISEPAFFSLSVYLITLVLVEAMALMNKTENEGTKYHRMFTNLSRTAVRPRSSTKGPLDLDE